MNESGRDASGNSSIMILEQLLAEAKQVKEEDFGKWYEKKRKVFNTGVKKYPTKEEFIKYINYAISAFSL